MDYKNTPEGKAVQSKYGKILHASRPEPPHNHPRMPMSNRAKIFSPFAALRGYEDEIASESMGVNVTRVKVIAFTIGAMVTAVAGSLYAGFIGTVTPKDFTWMKSVDALIIVVLGGLGSITGTIIAAVILGLLNMFLQDFGAIRMIIYSLILILVMIFRPGGLLGTWEFKLSSFFNKKENKESN